MELFAEPVAKTVFCITVTQNAFNLNYFSRKKIIATVFVKLFLCFNFAYLVNEDKPKAALEKGQTEVSAN